MTGPARGPEEPQLPKSFSDEVADQAGKFVDGKIDSGFKGWYAGQTSDRKAATQLLLFSASVGVVGVPLFSAIQAARAPGLDVKNVQAVFWLLVLTLPVAAFAAVAIWGIGKGSFPVILALAGIAAYGAGVLLAGAGIPANLGDLYCYASIGTDGVYYESACREFDSLGFLGQTRPLLGSPSRAAEIFQWAMVYVAEARGFVMAWCGVMAGAAVGYLARDI